MKKIILVSFLFVSTWSFAQTNELVGQYYQNLPAYSPSQTGMNDFLDINMGFRQQWVGFNGSPKNVYLSAYGILKANKTKPASVDYNAAEAEEQQANPSVFRKHGIGGYLMSNTQGYYNQREIAATYAYHIPVVKGTYVSIGMSPTLYVEKIDMMNFTVKDQANDDAYQSLVNNGNKYSSLQLNIGASVYSDKFYFSYSMRQAGKVSLNGNRDIFSPNITKRHHLMGGMIFHASSKLDLIPNAFIRFDATRPTLLELGVRAKYNQNIWTGLSYRNDRTIVGAFGILFKNKYKFSYAYEHKNLGISKNFGISNTGGGTHELLIGMQMFKYKKESF